MARNSFLNETIIWSGRPQRIATPPIMKAFAACLFVASLVWLSFASAWLLALGSLHALAWTLSFASLGGAFAALHLPRVWLREVEYIVTEHHVILRRGSFRRTIERRSISFARVFWAPDGSGTGDLELVRAVPTGALRRRLKLRFDGLAAPDRVWAIVRGAVDVAPTGRGERPLTQRLDADERVLWSARPKHRSRAYWPRNRRQKMQLTLSVFLLLVIAATLWRAVPVLQALVAAGLQVLSVPFAAVTLGVLLTLLLVVSIAAYLAYDATLVPARLMGETRYLISSKRVLIQRGYEELHVDRDKIVEVINAPSGDGLSDVFMVLDGPRARALAASGAFGEMQRSPHLRPVFESVDDGESVDRILRNPQLPRAA